MFDPHLSNTVTNWEHRLEIEEERRKSHRREPYINYLAPVTQHRSDRPSIFTRILARIFKRAKDRQPQYCCPAREIQPG